MTEEEMRAEIANLKESIDKLTAKNNELIGTNKKIKADAETAKTEAEERAEEAARNSGKIEELETSLKAKHAKALAAIEAERDAANQHLKTLLIDNSIQKALADNNVAAPMHAALTALFKTGATVVDGQAVRDEVDLATSMKKYFSSDEGKHFVNAKNNSGGGAVGSTSHRDDRWAKPPVTAQDMTDLQKLAVEDPAYYNSVVERHGMSQLKV